MTRTTEGNFAVDLTAAQVAKGAFCRDRREGTLLMGWAKKRDDGNYTYSFSFERFSKPGNSGDRERQRLVVFSDEQLRGISELVETARAARAAFKARGNGAMPEVPEVVENIPDAEEIPF